MLALGEQPCLCSQLLRLLFELALQTPELVTHHLVDKAGVAVI